MTPAYKRNLKSRERARHGLKVYRIELSAEHTAGLIAHGLLGEGETADNVAVSKAVGVALAAYKRLAGRIMPDAPQSRLERLNRAADALLTAVEGKDTRAPISLIIDPLNKLYEARNG